MKKNFLFLLTMCLTYSANAFESSEKEYNKNEEAYNRKMTLAPKLSSMSIDLANIPAINMPPAAINSVNISTRNTINNNINNNAQGVTILNFLRQNALNRLSGNNLTAGNCLANNIMETQQGE